MYVCIGVVSMAIRYIVAIVQNASRKLYSKQSKVRVHLEEGAGQTLQVRVYCCKYIILFDPLEIPCCAESNSLFNRFNKKKRVQQTAKG